jgi:release factor glutamine methyltransferase
VTLALETTARVIATDISPAALRVAAANARRLQARVEFVACDLASALAGPFDLIATNPPYVPSAGKAGLQPEVRDFEPEIALYGGPDGTDVYRRLIPEARALLKPRGWLVMELGEARAVRDMLFEWEDVEVLCDLAGLPRVVVARRP